MLSVRVLLLAAIALLASAAPAAADYPDPCWGLAPPAPCAGLVAGPLLERVGAVHRAAGESLVFTIMMALHGWSWLADSITDVFADCWWDCYVVDSAAGCMRWPPAPCHDPFLAVVICEGGCLPPSLNMVGHAIGDAMEVQGAAGDAALGVLGRPDDPCAAWGGADGPRDLAAGAAWSRGTLALAWGSDLLWMQHPSFMDDASPAWRPLSGALAPC